MNPVGGRIVAVLGMHRSGTSLVTRALQVLGVSLGDQLMAPSDGNNAKGFFEDVEINELNIALLRALDCDWQSIRPLEQADFDLLYRAGWVDQAIAVMRAKIASVALFGFKDPRTAKLLPFWQEVFRAGGFSVTYLLAIRNPASVADSLLTRDGLPRARSYYLWLEHVLNSLTGTVGCQPVLVDYDDFFGDADGVLEQMAAGLGLCVDADEREEFSNEFLDERLRHTVHCDADLLADPSCPPLVAEVYQGLKDALRNNRGVDSPQLRSAMARWATEFERTKPALRLADACTPAPAQAAPASAALELLKAVARQDRSLLRSVFDQRWYQLAYADVAAAGIDPFLHYSETGVHEGRFPGPDVVLAALGSYRDRERQDEQRWADMIALQRSMAEQVQALQQQLHASLERHAEHDAHWQQLAAARDRVEALLRQAAQQESEAQQRALEQAESRWSKQFAQARADDDALSVRAAADRRALEGELNESRAQLAAIESSVLWRALAPFSRWRTRHNK
ncbi:MAG: hypothetical protein V4484_11315 [Pseudomonadota bacterium]